MKTLSIGFLTVALSLAQVAHAVVDQWGQCGGQNWAGETVCADGLTCVYSNAFYSQCLAGSTTAKPTSTSTTSKPSSTSTTKPSSTVSSTTTTVSSTSSAPPSTATGFVKTSGQKFTLNGAPFTVVGENAYWVGFMGLDAANINKAFADIAGTGATVVRTWAFNDVTSVPSGVYYQAWSGSTPIINTGSTGLGNFDVIVAAAKANGLRLIVTLTNNWSDYGGMDVYVKAITGTTYHDYFYTDANVIKAYKSYIATWVARYKNEPTVFAWELANEPRCSGSSTSTTSGKCTTTTITNWAADISAYIKSLDSNHLVALGDEGFMNQPSGSTYPYQIGEGIDFPANLKISTLDFGTFHMYPESWGQSGNSTLWGQQWIIDHAALQKAANKPVILEEYGVTTGQAATYAVWWNTVVSSGLAGDLTWQAGSHTVNGDSWNDGYSIYPDGAIYPLLKAHFSAVKARG